MEQNHQEALYVAYYLARFDKEALRFLNYSTWTEAFNDIAYKLKVQKHSVKNWRDEFDPLFGHRKGWHKRPMAPSRLYVAEEMKHLKEKEIRKIVLKIFDQDFKK